MLDTVDLELPDARPATVAAVGELAFRIRGGDYDGRVVRIRAAKCTIGAAPDCTLRLSAAGVRPLHCVIFRGEAGSTVRRWSSDTQLNGRAFSDSLLMAGDRLQIGPVELEVLEDAALNYARAPLSSIRPTLAEEPTSAGGPLPVASLAGEIAEHLKRDLTRKKADPRLLRERKRVRQARDRVKSLRAHLRQAEEASLRLQAESHRLKQELDFVQERCSKADRQLQQFAQEGLASTAAVEQLRHETDEARRQWEREIAAVGDDRQRLEYSLEELRNRLTQRDEELAELRVELSFKLEEWRRERIAFQSAIDHHQLHAAEQQRSYEAADEQWQQQQTAWQQELQSLLKSLEEKQHLEQRLDAALTEVRNTVDQKHSLDAAAREELAQERAKLHDRTVELEKLQAWCEEAEQRAQQMARDEAAARNEAARLREHAAELESRLAGRAEKASQEESSADEQLRQQLADALRAQQAATLRQQELQGELAGLEQQHTEQRAAYERLQAEYDQRATAAELRESQLAAQTGELDALTQQVTDLESRCHELQALAELRDAEKTSLLERVHELERASHTGHHAEPTTAHTEEIASAHERIRCLEAELSEKLTELSLAKLQVEETSRLLADRDATWTKREQELLKQLQCLENLARNLESDLRAASQQDPAGDASQGERLQLQQQLTSAEEQLAAAQQQWTQQRETLEEQSLAAYQQVQTLEDQLGATRKSLTETRSQIEQRDQLLAQLRDEVREQMALWLRERDELRAELTQARHEAELTAAASSASGSGAISAAAIDPMSNRGLGECEGGPVADMPAEDLRDPPPLHEDAPVKVEEILNRLGVAQVWEDAVGDQGCTPVQLDARVDGDADAQAMMGMPSDISGSLTASAAEASEHPTGAEAGRNDAEVEEVAEASAASLTEGALEGSVAEGSVGAETSSNTAEEEEDSIEAYMARLLKRVRGDSVANAFVSQQEVVEVASQESGETTADTPESSPVAALRADEYAPRSPAPEQQIDLAAMREVAIHSARQAITQSTQRRRRQAAVATMCIAAGSVVASATLLYWGWQTGNALAYASGATVLASGIIWSIHRARRAPRGRVRTSPAATAQS
jgi:predicted  nucleic acid-binding Zn-ribbon protein